MERPDIFRGVKDDAYDPNKVYSRATNTFNHSKQVRVSFPPETVAVINQYVSLVPEYHSQQDVMRDAIHHHLQRLADRAGDFSSQAVLARERLHVMVSQRKARFSEQREAVETVRQHLRELEQEGMYDEIQSIVDETQMMDYDLDPSWETRLQAVVAEGQEMVERARRRVDQ